MLCHAAYLWQIMYNKIGVYQAEFITPNFEVRAPMAKFLLCLLLSLSANSAMAASVAIYKDKRGQVLLTNVQPSGKFDKYRPKVRETYYRSDSSINQSTATKNHRSRDVYLAMADDVNIPSKKSTISNNIIPYSRKNTSNNDYSAQNTYSTNNGGIHISNNSEITRAIKVLQQKGNELDSSSKRFYKEKNKMSNDIYLAMADNTDESSESVNAVSAKNEDTVSSNYKSANTTFNDKKNQTVSAISNKGTAYVPSDYEIAQGIQLNKQKTLMESEALSKRLYDKKVADRNSKLTKFIVDRAIESVFTRKLF